MLSTFDEPTRVAIQENLVEFGNALAGRGPDLNAALGALPDVVRRPEAGDAQPRLAEDRGSSRFITGSAAAAAEVAPVAEVQAAAVRLARHHLQRARRGRPPVHPGDDLRDAADLRRRRARAAGDPALPRPQRRAVHRPAPGRRRARAPTRRRSPPRSRSGRRSCATRRRSTTQLAPTAAGAAARSTTTTRCRDGPRPPAARPPTSSARRCSSSRRRRPSATTRRSCSRNAAEPVLPGRRRRHVAAVHGLRAARPGRTTRARVASAPGQRRRGLDPGNFLHYNPYPNTAAPGQKPKECEAGNEPYLDRPAGDRQRARQPGHVDRPAAGLRHDRGGSVSPRQVPKRDPGKPAPDPRIWGRYYRGPAPWVFGLIVVLLLAIGRLPGVHQEASLHRQRLRADRDVRERGHACGSSSPVRIAGVNVGKVTVGRGATATPPRSPSPSTTRASRSTTTPQVAIRPRLFLEGNFFLDLRPGSPSAPELDDGQDIPITQTSTAVQLDEVLTALQAALARGPPAAARGLRHRRSPTSRPPADDADQDPIVAGETAAEALNDTFRYGGDAGQAARRSSTRRCSARTRTTSPGSSRSAASTFEKLAEPRGASSRT